jgi:hypothetical protein
MANRDIFTYGLETRFQPGVSGNKKGRPKGSLNVSTLVKQLLDDEDFADKVLVNKPSYWKHLPNKNFATAVVTAMIIKALGGDINAATWLRRTGYGDKVELPGQEHTFVPVPIFNMRTGQEMIVVPKPATK